MEADLVEGLKVHLSHLIGRKILRFGKMGGAILKV